jgi:hypothetical protein
MYFTLAISAATPEACAALAGAAGRTDPRVMPIPGPARVAWHAPGGRAAVLHWGDAPSPGTSHGATSHAGTIWAEGATVRARTGLARVDPVYLAEVAGAVVVSDRACWAAAVTGRLGDPDPAMAGAFLSLGYPVGDATPFRGVRALGGDRELRLIDGRVADGPSAGGRPSMVRAEDEGAAGAEAVARALTEAVRPLGGADPPAELSLTGGKDSRLIAAALAAARVPFRARTHGFAGHPDVVVAGLIAARLGVEHTVTRPRLPGTPDEAPGEASVLGRLRAAVLVSDGMLSAFENLGSGFRPDPQAAGGPAETGGHGGELLRGGYAQAAWRTQAAAAAPLNAAAAAEFFRRMTTRRLGLLRPGPALAYLATLAPPAAALARGPLAELDDFYLANRAGRWSAAARQAYLLRSPLVQPLFADRVVRAARAVPLRDRMSDRLHRDVLGLLCPELLSLPLAGTPWHGQPRTPATVLTVPARAAADWRRDYGDIVAGFLRGYVLDHAGTSPVFGIVRRSAAERLLRAPQADRQGAWALATLTALLTGDWLNARVPAGEPVSRGRTSSRPARSTARPRGG